MQTRIVESTANPVTEICDGQAYALYYLCFYLFPATDYCLKPWLRKFFRHLQQAALFPLLNFAIWKKCALALNHAVKIKPGQIERSNFFPLVANGYKGIYRVIWGQLDALLKKYHNVF